MDLTTWITATDRPMTIRQAPKPLTLEEDSIPLPRRRTSRRLMHQAVTNGSNTLIARIIDK
jgi:hypothetical protein